MPRLMNTCRRIAAFALTLLAIVGASVSANAQIVLPGSAPTDDNAPPTLSIAQELGLGGLNFGGSGKHVQLFGSFTVQKGSRRGILSVAATIDPGWHIYSISQLPGGASPSKITPEKSPSYELLGKFQPDREPKIKRVEVFPVPLEEHEGAVTWTAPIQFAEGVDVEKLAIPIKYQGQVCGAPTPGGSEVCIPLDEQINAEFSGFTEPPTTPGEYRPDPAQAQVVITGHIEPAAVAPGGKAKLVITATPNPEWHIYAYATQDPDKVGMNKPTLIYLSLIHI